MDLQDVLYEQDGNVATIWLNRPERLNALGGRLERDLNNALEAAEADPSVRAVVLTGAGRAFSSGLDVKERAALKRPHRVGLDYVNGLETPRLLLRMNTPVIAAINGYAIGWGFELTLLCDYRLASEEARMADFHVKLGRVQDAGSVLTLPRLVGWSKACKILLTGEQFSAAEMLELGVVDEVVPGEDLLPKSLDLAHRIARNAPLAVQMTKRLMRMALRSDLDDILDQSMLMMGAMAATEDSAEGFAALAEKRTPEFRGR